MSEIYNSSTHGPIPLSFHGRHLLATLREAIAGAIEADDFSANGAAVSKARGELAKYMSKLEERQEERPESLWDAPRDFYAPPPFEFRSAEQRVADEFVDAAAKINEARAALVTAAKQAQEYGLTPTWESPWRTSRYTKSKPFVDGQTFLPLSFEVSRTVKKERTVVDEHTEVMGKTP